ncbi:MAG: hypothetical protein ACRCTK_02540, partial [Alphaproteobacteria bacterium]
EQLYERIVWCGPNDGSPPPFDVRPQDAWRNGALWEALQAPSLEIPLETLDLIWMMALPGMLASLQGVLKTTLSHRLKPSCQLIATLNAPMQCMMKGVCGQCACVKTVPNQPLGIVFLCESQDQFLDAIDLKELQQRLDQQPLLEKLLHLLPKPAN